MEGAISCEDKDIETFVPTMGRICFSGVVELFNEEHLKNGSDLARTDLIPEDLNVLDEACKLLCFDEDHGFIEKVFDVNTRIT